MYGYEAIGAVGDDGVQVDVAGKCLAAFPRTGLARIG